MSLRKNIISKNVFNKEIDLCKKLNKKCNWGKCGSCGVIPLLYKLHKGILIEDKKELEKLRKEILKD